MVYLVSSYAFTSLVSLTVASCVSCFLHSTVVVRAMIAVKSLHHPTNHCLSHPSLLAPPTKPRYRTHACICLPTTTSHWYLPSVTTLSVPSNRVIIILLITWSYPLFPHSVGSRHSAQSCNCRFLLAQRPCLFYFVSKSLLFRPFVGFLAGVVAFPLDGPLLCCGSRCVVSVPWYTWVVTA